MESPTTFNKTLQIEGMTGDACVTKVTTALTGLKGVTLQGVKVGTANIVTDKEGLIAARAAINTAGFKTGTPDTLKNTTETKPGATPAQADQTPTVQTILGQQAPAIAGATH